MGYPEFLNIRPYMSQSSGEPVVYGLYAVLVHSGYSCHAGHYYCYVKVGGPLTVGGGGCTPAGTLEGVPSPGTGSLCSMRVRSGRGLPRCSGPVWPRRVGAAALRLSAASAVRVRWGGALEGLLPGLWPRTRDTTRGGPVWWRRLADRRCPHALGSKSLGPWARTEGASASVGLRSQ